MAKKYLSSKQAWSVATITKVSNGFTLVVRSQTFVAENWEKLSLKLAEFCDPKIPVEQDAEAK
jgi:hypothetical protein